MNDNIPISITSIMGILLLKRALTQRRMKSETQLNHTGYIKGPGVGD